MAMLLGTKGKDILEWRASQALVTVLEGKLARKWEYSSSREDRAFLGEYLAALRQELDYEGQLSGELALLEQEFEKTRDPAELLPLKERYLELAAAHFNRRRSVLALCGLCNQLHDRVLHRALAQAAERMQQLGQGAPPPYTLLVSGDRGRREETLRGSHHYFFLYREEHPRFILFRRQLGQVLLDLGMVGADRGIWHGSLADLAVFAGETFRQGTQGGGTGQTMAALPPFANPVRAVEHDLPPWHWRLEALADLSWLEGDKELGQEALQVAARTFSKERIQPPFLYLARKVIDLPLALGLFSRWRVQRSGAHQGELDLEELGLTPLVMTLRVLALHAGVQASSTVERIQQLLYKGALDVDLADRLLKAYQTLMQHKIRGEIRGEDGCYLNPEELGEAEGTWLRDAVETVLNLQKIAYQRLVVQG